MKRHGLDPLVIFLVLGLVLAGLHLATRAPDVAPSAAIVVTDADVAWLAEAFERTRLRPPTEEELRGLVERHVRDELLYREATALGLDREDPALRRRLALKLEYLAKDLGTANEPTDAELQAWLDARPERYAAPPRRTFQQIYLSADRRGAAVEQDATALLARLRGASPPAPDTVGDPILLELDQPPSTPADVERQFGRAFAEALFRLPVGAWDGPVPSGYGLHLVRVLAETPGVAATLETARDAVRNDLFAERKEKAVEDLVEALRAKYGVEIRAGRLREADDAP